MDIWDQILCLKNRSYAFSAGIVMIFTELESIQKVYKKIFWRNDSGSMVYSIIFFHHRTVRLTIGDSMQNSLEPMGKFLLVFTGFGPCSL